MVALVFGLLALPACSSRTDPAELGQQFDLAIGQATSIAKDNLMVRFNQVIEDSRCPFGALCIWEGRASAEIRLTKDGQIYTMVLIEPGHSESRVEEYQNYRINYRILPYPKVGQTISKSDYRLELTITKR